MAGEDLEVGPTLTAEELAAARYEAAVARGEVLDMNCDDEDEPCTQETEQRELPSAGAGTLARAAGPAELTCAICYEATEFADLPCCDATGSTFQCCLECLVKLCARGGGTAQCPRCRAPISIRDYGGDVLGTKDAMRLGDKSYLMRLGGDVYVDARRRDDVQARYINDARDKRVHNVAFRKLPDLRKAEVVVSRPVDAGDEFYASYGTFYWLSLDMRGEVSARLPEDQVRALVAKEAAFWDGAPPRPPEPPEAEGGSA